MIGLWSVFDRSEAPWSCRWYVVARAGAVSRTVNACDIYHASERWVERIVWQNRSNSGGFAVQLSCDAWYISVRPCVFEQLEVRNGVW